MKTQPIAITQHHSRRRQRSHPPLYEDSHFTKTNDGSESEQNNYETNDAKNFFCGSLNDLNSNMGALTVGSLPSSRRERRFIVSTGTNESIYSRRANNGVYPYQQTRNDDDGIGGGGIGGALANSMAPPSAPFLSSRRGSAETIQSMPIMDLPESAKEYNDPYKGAPHIIPYGSLRESRFHQRRIHNSPQQLQRMNTNNGFETNPEDDPKLAGSYSRSYSDDSYFPQSMPVNKFERNIIQKRWEKYNQSDDTEPTTNHDSNYLETNVTTSGIQKLLDGSSENNQSNKPISNLSSQLEDSRNAEFNDSNISELGKSIEVSSLAKNNNDRLNKNNSSFVSGLGRSLQDSNSQITSSHQVSHDDSFALSHDTSSTNPQFVHARPSTPNSLHLTPECNDSDNQLSSSLTGLDILEFAKKSPGGLSVDLTKEEKDSLLGRARTFSDDGSKIINTANNNNNHNGLGTRFTHTPPKHLIANEGSMQMNPPKLLPPMNLGGPQLLSQNAHHNVYNAVYEGYSNESLSPQNPDTEGAFDLDFDE